MKEIGEKLRQARENMGLTVEEAADDLKIKPSQIENVEIGNKAYFKDVFTLKQFVKDYAKYLGLEYDKLVDEFNEYVFEYTSKIPLDNIAKESEKRNKEKEQAKEISSPYTLDVKGPLYLSKWLLLVALIIVFLILSYFIVRIITNNDNNKQDIISLNNIEMRQLYEFTK